MPHRIDHATAERQFRTLLESHDLPQPDEVSHWRDAIVLGWRDTKAVIVIDLDEVGETLTHDEVAPLGDVVATA